MKAADDVARFERGSDRRREDKAGVVPTLPGFDLLFKLASVVLEIEVSLPDGASDQIVRTVTENSRTLRFTSQGFEAE